MSEKPTPQTSAQYIFMKATFVVFKFNNNNKREITKIRHALEANPRNANTIAFPSTQNCGGITYR